MSEEVDDNRPVLSAVSSSARQLFALLRCISFGSKFLVQPTEDGIRFSVEESSVMQGMVFLAKTLFTSFQYAAPPATPDESEQAENGEGVTPFSISLPALLETLQIFGASEATKFNPWNRDHYSSDAFSAPMLGMTGICRLKYESVGSPLVVVLEEPGISTTCELVTYEPDFTSDIPFARNELSMKIIMGASHLSDAIAELSTSSPERLTVTATEKSLILSALGDLGSAIVHFDRQVKDTDSMYTATAPGTSMESGPAAPKGVLETFMVSASGFNQSYKFAHIATTRKALTSAIKVSIRGDNQGVLSLQFMIENLEGHGVSFVDYRFVPLVREGSDDDDDYDDDDGQGDEAATE